MVEKNNPLNISCEIIEKDFTLNTSLLLGGHSAWYAYYDSVKKIFTAENLELFFKKNTAISINEAENTRWMTLFKDIPPQNSNNEIRRKLYSYMFFYGYVATPSDKIENIVMLCIKERLKALREDLYSDLHGHIELIKKTVADDKCPGPVYLYSALRYAYPDSTPMMAVERISMLSRSLPTPIWNGGLEIEELEYRATNCLAADVYFGAKFLLLKFGKRLGDDLSVALSRLIEVIIESYFIKNGITVNE